MMGVEFQNLSCEELCDLMCGKPEEDEDFEEEICGRCIHHRRSNEEWICNNPDSECYGGYTEYKDACDDFEER